MSSIRTTITTTLVAGLLMGSSAGVAAQGEGAATVAPAPFVWSFAGESEVISEGVFDDSVAGRVSATGMVDSESIAATDQRASGASTVARGGSTLGDPDTVAPPFGDDLSAPPPELFTVTSISRRIVNDGGSWSGTGYEYEYQSEGGDDLFILGFETLDGEDGYEGLSLVLTYDGELGMGWILPTDAVQPPPELPAE